ncbi:MAG: 4Fe-4S dicluster domain-containing protein [Desulfobulbus sp.]|nr:4Fe-4S dicluster domain-containing protein [Desulfobulbus sp.]
MDVRAFMEHMADGKLREARKVLELHLPVPEIMARICDHPCEDHCLRRDLGGSLAIGALEAFCIGNADKQSKSFPRAPKAVSIAVLGNGLAGLVVAFELSRKAYPVTIFHEGEAHGTLLQRFSSLAQEHVAREYEGLLKAGCTVTERVLDAALLEKARSGFTAVFVDADAAAGLFAGLGAAPDPATGFVTGNICAGGMLAQSPTGALYASSSKQASEGRRSAVTLERLVTGVSLTAERGAELTRETPLHTPLDGVMPKAPVLPQGDAYLPEEAMQEAARCIRCECLACVRECVYLQKYGGYPRTYARQIYNNASIVKGGHLANALINGCMLCGQCTELCPERFSMAELCLSARQDMVTRGYMPASAHEFALEDMESANSETCALFMGDPGGKKTVYAFFPGCQLAASRGEQVLATYEFLHDALPSGEGVGLFLSCCGVPAHWAGSEEKFQSGLARIRAEWERAGRPTLIMACASCLKTFGEAAPGIPTVSLWAMLDGHLMDMPTKPAEKTYCIHDPCAARHDEAWQKAVRSLAAKCGVSLEEPRRTGMETACCGYGGLMWNAQPELAAVAARHKADALDKPALASCIMCRDRLVASGKECLHLLDILPFSKTDDGSKAALAAPPGLSARRANRAALAGRVRVTYLGGTALSVTYRVTMAPELLVELERKHILREDVERSVLAIEAAGARFCERRSGHYVGSWRPRRVTFWVRYSANADGTYVLHDAWCHRMTVPDAGRPGSLP